MQERPAKWIARLIAVALGAIAAFPYVACNSADPRCTSLCQVHDATYGDVCSQASASSCVDQCDAQIAGTTAACSACLLQGASFETDSTVGTNNNCASSTQCNGQDQCTLPKSGCTYCSGDMAAEQACFKKEFPRTEVACAPKFRDPAKCSSVCPATR
jgi:hypothetical protein